MKLDNLTNQIYVVAMNEARLQNHEYLTPEHYLYAALMFDLGKAVVAESGGDPQGILKDLQAFFEDKIPKLENESPVDSFAFIQMFEMAVTYARNLGCELVTIGDVISAMFGLRESHASYILEKNGVNRQSLTQAAAKARRESEDGATASEQADGNAKKDGEFLENYAVNLTEQAVKGLLDPVIGREEVLTRTVRVLCRRVKNNPVHVGDPGVGKTAITEGLAQMIAAGRVPGRLAGAQIFRLDMGALLAGTRYRGDFEERLVKLLNIIKKTANPIVYLDEIHTVVGAGAVSGGGMDATGIIKPFLARGELRFIGATTHDEYRRFFEKDRGMERRFQRIEVEEPDVGESVRILTGLKGRYEEFHNVVYTDEVLRTVCELSALHINDRYLPDKAIDIMDETGAAVRMRRDAEPDGKAGQAFACVVTVRDVERTVSGMAKIPENTVTTNELHKLRDLNARLRERIFGQDEAVETVTDAIKASRSGLNNPERPVANLLFVGPTGVGKTEIARQLAFFLGISLQRFDMSEYQEKHTVARLIGAPPGYVGYDAGGIMTEAVRRNPNCVLLLDEVEKASPEIHNVLLQIMDYGTLTDNTGKKTDFHNVILIMTSNAGASELGRRVVGFEGRYNTGAIDKEIERVFNPEFRNRLDATVVFNKMDANMAANIARKAVSELALKLEDKNVKLDPTERLIEWIAQKGMSELYGAREIIRVVENDIKKPLVERLLFGDLAAGGAVRADADRGMIQFTVTESNSASPSSP